MRRGAVGAHVPPAGWRTRSRCKSWQAWWCGGLLALGVAGCMTAPPAPPPAARSLTAVHASLAAVQATSTVLAREAYATLTAGAATLTAVAREP